MLVVAFCAFFGVSFSSADSLGEVDINFCDQGSWTIASGMYVSGANLFYKIWVAQEWNICYTITNKSLQNVFVKISFVDGTFTNDQWKNKACLSDTDIQYFGQYVTWYQQLVALSGWTSVSQNARFTYPVWSDGIYHGCLVYSVLSSGGQNTSPWANFAVLMRRAKFIDVFVGNHKAAAEHAISLVDFDAASGENLSPNTQMRVYVDPSDGKYVLQFQLKNNSSSDQDVVVTWYMSNFLQSKNTFIEPRRLLRGETLLVTKKFDTIPLYNMNISLNISHQSYYTFEWETPFVGRLSAKTHLWIVDSIFIITVVGLVLFAILLTLLLILIKKQKVHTNSSSQHVSRSSSVSSHKKK